MFNENREHGRNFLDYNYALFDSLKASLRGALLRI